MPVNYTNNEFMRMRDQAIVNAREMQRRATIKESASRQPSAVEDFLQETESANSTLRFEKQPEAKEVFRNNAPHPNNRQSNNIHKQHHHKPPAQDNDRMLIMTLLLILIADGADKMLIFALMYIMM